MIVVDQPDALIDQPIAIVLRGFTPRQPVSVTATQTYADAVRWQSRATFVSDDDGQVDVTRQAPVSGTYEGVAPMGLFWSMDLVPGETRPVPAAQRRPMPRPAWTRGASCWRFSTTRRRRTDDEECGGGPRRLPNRGAKFAFGPESERLDP